jgi:flagellar hook-basal body complex protein FliE
MSQRIHKEKQHKSNISISQGTSSYTSGFHKKNPIKENKQNFDKVLNQSLQLGSKTKHKSEEASSYPRVLKMVTRPQSCMSTPPKRMI